MKEKETKNTIEQASLNFVSSASSLPIMYIVRSSTAAPFSYFDLTNFLPATI